MKILNIQITKLRGIVELNIDLNGKNAVIWGQNGVGKSAVVDAIDFLLTGNITRLSGENTKEISIARHGAHVGYPTSQAQVSATIMASDGQTFTVTRKIESRETVEIPLQYKDCFEDISKYALNGAHFLSRRELLRYILTTPGKRSEEIQELLGITDIKVKRDALNKLSKKAKAACDEAINEEKNNTERLLQLLGIEQISEALTSVNQLRLQLGGEQLSDLDDGQIINGLTYSATNVDDIIKYANGVKCAIAIYSEKILSLNSSNEDIKKRYANLAKAEGVIDNKTIALVKAGILLLNGTGKCPLCLNQWKSDDELRSFLIERQRKGEEASKLLDEVSNYCELIKSDFMEIQKALSIVSTKSDEYAPATTLTIQSLLVEIKSVLIILAGNINVTSNQYASVEKAISSLSTNSLSLQLNELNEIVTPLVEAQSTNRNRVWQQLNEAQNFYMQTISSRKTIPILQQISQKAARMLELYDSAQEEQLNQLYQSISERFALLYKVMHQEDEEEFSVNMGMSRQVCKWNNPLSLGKH